MRRGLTWHLGLGRELGYVFWGMCGLEAAFGAYMSVWPLWIEALGASVEVVGLVLGFSGLLRLAAVFPSAALAERFDARRLILVARTVAGLGMITAALATHWTQLLVMLVASAIGEVAFPLVQTYISAHSGADRVRVFTLIVNVGPATAMAVSPLVSGLVVGWWGMRAAFLLGAALTVVSIGFLSRLRSGRDESRRTARAGTYLEALADPPSRRLLTLQFATLFALALGTTFVPTFLKDERGLSPATITVLSSVWAIGAALFGLLVTRVDRLQRAPCVGIAIAVSLVAASLAALTVAVPFWLIVVVMLGRGGFFSAWALFLGALGEVAGERHRSRVFALSQMLGGGAISLAPMVAGLIYAWRPAAPLLAAAVLAAFLVPVIARTQRLVGQHRGIAAPPLVEPELA